MRRRRRQIAWGCAIGVWCRPTVTTGTRCRPRRSCTSSSCTGARQRWRATSCSLGATQTTSPAAGWPTTRDCNRSWRSRTPAEPAPGGSAHLDLLARHTREAGGVLHRDGDREGPLGLVGVARGGFRLRPDDRGLVAEVEAVAGDRGVVGVGGGGGVGGDGERRPPR